MTARQQRRHEERIARKQAYKAQKQTEQPQGTAVPSTRAEINRDNSQHSTGPRTESGKLASSRNSFKHGLYSKQLVMPGEDPAELDALRDALRREHQPANTTEEILVNELAEHFWRLRRMRKFEARIMGAGTIEELHKGFAILPIVQRTMAAAERGFHKALATLKQLQKERGFVPQKQETPVESVSQKPAEIAIHDKHSGFVLQNDPSSVSTSGLESQNDSLIAAA